MNLEHPEFSCSCVDLDVATHTRSLEEVRFLCNEISVASPEDQVAWRAGIRYVPRLRPCKRQDTNPDRDFLIRQDASYLITGGTGALGWQLLRWLADRGAKSLVTVSRSGLNQEARAEAERPGRQGRPGPNRSGRCHRSRTIAQQAFLCSQRLASAERHHHAAGVLADGMLSEQTPARFRTVMAPKMEGAVEYPHLCSGSEPRPGPRLFLLSSAASLLGNLARQIMAAACLLDSLAHYRSGKGLKATVVNWGPWEAGMAVTSTVVQDRFRKQGMQGLLLEDGTQLLETVLSQDLTQVAALACDWSQYRVFLQDTSLIQSLPFLSEVIPHRQQLPAAAQEPSLLTQLQGVLPDMRRKLLFDFVEKTIGQVMSFDHALELDVNTSLMDQGLDSLMAVSLRNAFGKAFNKTFPSGLIFRLPTINDIVDYLDAEVAASIPLLTPKRASRAMDREMVWMI